jgi:hypothetical protein
VTSGTVDVSEVVLDDGDREVVLSLDRRLRESVEDVEGVVTEVITEEFRRALSGEDLSLDSDVVRYGIARVVRDVVEELAERGTVEYEVTVVAKEAVSGDEAGVLADERRFPSARAALASVVRRVVRDKLEEELKEILAEH